MDDCILYIGGKDKDGYGLITKRLTKNATKTFRAHRVAWEEVNGPIPQGMLVCHKCDNPSCVNPNHLFIGTHKDNHQDKVNKGRSSKGTKNGRNKLTEAEARYIKTSNKSCLDLARKFAVSDTAIRYIKTNRNWSWL